MLLALLLAAVTPIVVPAENTVWVRARSEHFDVVSAAGARRTRDIADELEAFADTLQRLHPRLKKEGAATHVIVFARMAESQPFFDLLTSRKGAHTSGVFVRRAGAAGTMIVDSTGDWRSNRVPLHELVHDLMSSAGTRPPLWLEEGLAEYFSARGAPIREHRFLLARRGIMPLEQLFAMKFESEDALDPIFYAESWAAVNWLMQQGPDFDRFLEDVERGEAVETALQKDYGRSLNDLRRAIAATPKAVSRFAPLIIAAGSRSPVTLVPMSRADALYELGHFLGSIAGAEPDSLRLYDAAIAADPKHGPTLVALGRFDDALAARPDDAAIHLDYAEKLLGNALGPMAETSTNYDRASFRKARALAEQARVLGGDPGRVAATIGTSWMAENDASGGIEALRQAHELAPARADVALHLLALLYRRGDLGEADALLATLSGSREAEVALAARNVLQREMLGRANALVAQQKLAEAAAALRDLAPRLGPSSKRDLEQQARELDAAAESNRQIRLYNQAVDETNRGEWEQAKKTLDELLAGATAPQVIEDARRLQKELLQRH